MSAAAHDAVAAAAAAEQPKHFPYKIFLDKVRISQEIS
jgi:hypothetical protein